MPAGTPRQGKPRAEQEALEIFWRILYRMRLQVFQVKLRSLDSLVLLMPIQRDINANFFSQLTIATDQEHRERYERLWGE